MKKKRFSKNITIKGVELDKNNESQIIQLKKDKAKIIDKINKAFLISKVFASTY